MNQKVILINCQLREKKIRIHICIHTHSFHSFYIRAPKYVKQTQVLKGKVGKSKMILALKMDKETNRRKVRKYTETIFVFDKCYVTVVVGIF